MSYAENLWLFFLVLFGIIILPGMDMLFVLASALTGGKRTGLSAASGMSAGGIVHSLYGALGVGMLAAWMPSLFLPLLVFGAAYMIWIGIGLMRSAIVVNGDEAQASASVRKSLLAGGADLPFQSEGLSVHDGDLSAIPQTGLWPDLDAGAGDGCDGGGDAVHRLWRAGADGG